MKISVIGAGAAGMICAIECKKAGHDVTVFEKNEKCGKKLYITGKGRCNLTNLSDPETILKNVVSNPKFLYAAVNKFTAEDTYAYFENIGVPLKVERGNRVFPASDKSSDIITALKKEMARCGVVVLFKTEVSKILIKNAAVCGLIANGKTYPCDAVVVATGGKTYPATGSTGDGYRFATEAGHTVSDLYPSLTEIFIEKVCSATSKSKPLQFLALEPLEGLSLKNVSLTAMQGEKIIGSEFGEMLFTKKGISGPIALTISALISRKPLREVRLILDFKPALSEELLDARLLREMNDNKNKILKNILGSLLPQKLIPFFIATLGISAEKEVNQITKEERLSLLKMLKNMEFSGLSLGSFSEAVITSGGVSVAEINPKNMESKKVAQLFFIGEVLDIDALTGGFNLQIAFSTAIAAARELEKRGTYDA